MATGYIPNSSGWSKSGNFTGYLRLYYSTTYNASTNTSSVTITPQFKASANIGSDYRFFNNGNVSDQGIWVNGSQVYSFGSNYGSGNYLSCGSATNSWTNLNYSKTFTVTHDSTGKGTFTAGIVCSVIAMYNYWTLSPIGSKSGSVTLQEATPKWIISYDANGGNSTPATQSVTKGNSTTLAAAITHNAVSNENCIVTFDGNGGVSSRSFQSIIVTNNYTFEGWHAGSETGTLYAAGASYTPSSNITFYAGWVITSTGNTSITLPTAIECQRTGYILLGWSLDPLSNQASYSPGATISVSDNIIFYAVWLDFHYIKININNTWEKATPCIYINGKWEPFKAYIYKNNEWHYCGDEQN